MGAGPARRPALLGVHAEAHRHRRSRHTGCSSCPCPTPASSHRTRLSPGVAVYIQAVAGVSDALSSDLPDEVRQLPATPPVTEKKLLELGVAWLGISPSQARMADALRLFLITWDSARVARTAPRWVRYSQRRPSRSRARGLCTRWSLVELATERETMADVLGSMAGSAVVTAAAHEQSVTAGRYPDLVTQQAIPDCSPISRPAPRSVRSTCGSCQPGGRTSGSVPSPTSSSTLSARLTSTARRSSLLLPSNHTLVARPVRVASSISRPNWPRPKTGCARPIGARLGE